ncbi:2'-5' RNA ligase [Polaromonas sp. CG_9.5]|uniref:2'-5' RNA ligase family protein n=1 Tax=Polaromonas sp. CG_9.5 TaxID=3071705 RepID=UPI002E01A60A|nr:2'-5' RNA ligase [Polaromonas sp. CG_9.5]
METAFSAPNGLTLRNEPRDFPEWHLGRPHYALWALEVDVPALRQRVAAAARHLSGLLLPDYCRQPHVTLSLCGFPGACPEHADDFGVAALAAQLAALRHAQPRPFDIEVGALASFTSAPYLAVQNAGGQIAALRQCLAGGSLNDFYDAYTPHVTVGLYADAWPMPEVQVRLASFADREALRLRIPGISLLSYASARIGGELACMARYDFQSETLHWTASQPYPF